MKWNMVLLLALVPWVGCKKSEVVPEQSQAKDQTADAGVRGGNPDQGIKLQICHSAPTWAPNMYTTEAFSIADLFQPYTNADVMHENGTGNFHKLTNNAGDLVGSAMTIEQMVNERSVTGALVYFTSSGSLVRGAPSLLNCLYESNLTLGNKQCLFVKRENEILATVCNYGYSFQDDAIPNLIVDISDGLTGQTTHDSASYDPSGKGLLTVLHPPMGAVTRKYDLVEFFCSKADSRFTGSPEVIEQKKILCRSSSALNLHNILSWMGYWDMVKDQGGGQLPGLPTAVTNNCTTFSKFILDENKTWLDKGQVDGGNANKWFEYHKAIGNYCMEKIKISVNGKTVMPSTCVTGGGLPLADAEAAKVPGTLLVDCGTPNSDHLAGIYICENGCNVSSTGEDDFCLEYKTRACPDPEGYELKLPENWP